MPNRAIPHKWPTTLLPQGRARIVRCAAMPTAAARFIACLLLIGGLLMGGAPAFAATYQEPPSLADEVAAGRLPPVDQRLPNEPLVVDLKAEGKEPGKPGGTLRMLIGQGGDARSLLPFGYSRLVIYDENYRLVPDILKSFEV